MIGVCLLAVGAYSNLFYLVIILINITVGISQEIHARNLVKKLSIIAQQEIRVIRDGVTQSVDAKSLVLDDLVVIGAGEQIPADMVVLSGQADVNESMLTGEADLVVKEKRRDSLIWQFCRQWRGHCKSDPRRSRELCGKIKQ